MRRAGAAHGDEILDRGRAAGEAVDGEAEGRQRGFGTSNTAPVAGVTLGQAISGAGERDGVDRPRLRS